MTIENDLEAKAFPLGRDWQFEQWGSTIAQSLQGLAAAQQAQTEAGSPEKAQAAARLAEDAAANARHYQTLIDYYRT